MERVSFGSRGGTDSDYLQHGSSNVHKGVARGPCSSLAELTSALKDDISAGRESLVPGCTTSELSLQLSALAPLHRPSIGPYTEGEKDDLPPQFKTSWTNAAHGEKSYPQATIYSIITLGESRWRRAVQRAASRGIVSAIEAIDGFKYNFNNAWNAKEEDGQRCSYICQDSMQKKDRHANAFTRTRKHLRGEGAGGRKPTYDCKGSVSVKFSSARRCVDVYYRHYAIHPTLSESKSKPRPGPARARQGAISGNEPNSPEEVATEGLFAKLKNKKSVFIPPPHDRGTTPGSRSEPSNIGKTLKRKRDSDMAPASRDSGKPLSLVELLKQSQSATSLPTPSPSTSKTTSNTQPPPVSYDLPSWQQPPPMPTNGPQEKPSQPSQNGSQFPAPYPRPYRPNQPFQPHQSQGPSYIATAPQPQPPAPTPSQEFFGAPKAHPQSQGLFSTLKPVSQDPPIENYIPFWSARARTSCTGCRSSKKKVCHVRFTAALCTVN